MGGIFDTVLGGVGLGETMTLSGPNLPRPQSIRLEMEALMKFKKQHPDINLIKVLEELADAQINRPWMIYFRRDEIEIRSTP